MDTLIFILLLIFVGYGFSVILLPKKIQKYTLVLSPFVGITFVIVIGLALSVAKIGMDEVIISGKGLARLQGNQIIIFLSSLSWIYAFIFHKRMFRFYKQSLFIIPLILILLFAGIFTIPIRPDLRNMSLILQKNTLFDMVQDSGSLTNVNFQVGTPIVYSFFISVFHWIPKDKLLQMMYLSYLLTFGIYILVILIIMNNISTLRLFEYNGPIVLTSISIFSLATLNATVFFIALAFMAVYFLYKFFFHRSLQYLFTLFKIVLLTVLINPFFMGLIIKTYIFS